MSDCESTASSPTPPCTPAPEGQLSPAARRRAWKSAYNRSHRHTLACQCVLSLLNRDGLRKTPSKIAAAKYAPSFDEASQKWIVSQQMWDALRLKDGELSAEEAPIAPRERAPKMSLEDRRAKDRKDGAAHYRKHKNVEACKALINLLNRTPGKRVTESSRVYYGLTRNDQGRWSAPESVWEMLRAKDADNVSLLIQATQ